MWDEIVSKNFSRDFKTSFSHFRKILAYAIVSFFVIRELRSLRSNLPNHYRGAVSLLSFSFAFRFTHARSYAWKKIFNLLKIFSFLFLSFFFPFLFSFIYFLFYSFLCVTFFSVFFVSFFRFSFPFFFLSFSFVADLWIRATWSRYSSVKFLDFTRVT